jgi:hypothetical protein
VGTAKKNMEINLTKDELAILLQLNECVFQGRKIPDWLLGEISKVDPKSEFFTVENMGEYDHLWLTKNWLELGEQRRKEKERQEKQRKLWCLISECRSDIINNMVTTLTIKREIAETLANRIIASKKLSNILPFFDLQDEYKELVPTQNEKNS